MGLRFKGGLGRKYLETISPTEGEKPVRFRSWDPVPETKDSDSSG